MLDLVTSDEYPAYETALLNAYGEEVTTTATGRPSRKMVPEKVPPPGLNYATVEKRRREGPGGRDRDPGGLRDDGGGAGGVGAVEGEPADQHLVPGAAERHRPAPQRPEGAEDLHVQKDWRVHEAMTYFTMYSYNFCWPVRTLRERDDEGRLATEDAGDGGRPGRSRLDDARMDHDARRSTTLRHHPRPGISWRIIWRRLA